MVGNASSSGEHGEIDFRFLWSRFLPRSSRKTSAGIDEWSIEGLHIVLDKIVRQVHHFGERLMRGIKVRRGDERRLHCALNKIVDYRGLGQRELDGRGMEVGWKGVG